jgi:hypothetical protein
MRKISMMLVPLLMIAAPLAAQPVSPHEKVSEIYKILELCPALKINRKALDRFAMLNGIDLTPGSRDERWFLRRAAYDIRRIRARDNTYMCTLAITKYGPQGGVAKGIMLTN